MTFRTRSRPHHRGSSPARRGRPRRRPCALRRHGPIARGADPPRKFIAPAALIVGGPAWAYLQYGQTPVGLGLLYGISPVVVAIIGYAQLTLGRTAVTRPAARRARCRGAHRVP